MQRIGIRSEPPWPSPRFDRSAAREQQGSTGSAAADEVQMGEPGVTLRSWTRPAAMVAGVALVFRLAALSPWLLPLLLQLL